MTADRSQKHGSPLPLSAVLRLLRSPALWTTVVRKNILHLSLLFITQSSFQDHWQDVTVGSILGLSIAYFAYRQYYPDLAAEFSHRPFSPRIKEESSATVLPVHHQSNNQRYDPPGGSRDYDSFELDGTVQRPGPQHLRDAWREHEDSGARESTVRPERRRSDSPHGNV